MVLGVPKLLTDSGAILHILFLLSFIRTYISFTVSFITDHLHSADPLRTWWEPDK